MSTLTGYPHSWAEDSEEEPTGLVSQTGIGPHRRLSHGPNRLPVDRPNSVPKRGTISSHPRRGIRVDRDSALFRSALLWT